MDPKSSVSTGLVYSAGPLCPHCRAMSSTGGNTTAAASETLKNGTWTVQTEELVTYISVILLALVPLYIGCHMSLAQKKPPVRSSATQF